jgi:hypothetical protein
MDANNNQFDGRNMQRQRLSLFLSLSLSLSLCWNLVKTYLSLKNQELKNNKIEVVYQN